jgi:hypothetical protein
MMMLLRMPTIRLLAPDVEYDDLVKIARAHLDHAVLAHPNDPQLNATVGVGYAILALVDRYVVKE